MDNKKTKTIYQLDTPFTTVQWPQISSKDQETIVELLCSILSPIGSYRSNHIIPSKGKRSKKRKRRDSKAGNEKSSETPPPPEISSHIVTGLNSIHRMLEESSKKVLDTKANPDYPKSETSPQTKDVFKPDSHFSAIFVARSDQPPILNSHLPQIIATASKAHPTKPSTRLVQLPKGSEIRIAAALGLSRVSFLGILDDSPNSKALVDLIRDCVEEIQIPWLDEARKTEYLGTKINSIQTSIGAVKAK
ncbi:hypothetical protein sscle_14g098290 [Sclerotinia sclerotiorum 1980 UF-70]|uniref:Uncharacterized protein n=1 Tax=Sclerotinia sclerotiorum (strain ATCC 18683 / 1980 / Ss-1) TaxID=665079 RepID=A0A1D9QJK6_SCLS1|nr:hypothetical protein sscle_14g098290 [Sclerotinia sclerotiorum 1980 UF-70]